jgi:flagellar biosynthetic protein FliR
MRFDEATLFAFLLVFTRCSAMFLASPIFGASTTPMQVRVFTCLCLAGALTMVIAPKLGPMPHSLVGMALTVGGEAVAGLLIGSLMSLVLQMMQLAGTFLDYNIGLGMSQTLNPMTGVPVTLIGEFKFMLGTVVFLSANAHHLMIQVMVDSYRHAPALSSLHLLSVQAGVLGLLQQLTLLALQIALPVTAVSLVVDAGLALISRAVPQMQALQVGMPAKLGAGLLGLSLALPPLVGAVTNGCGLAANLVNHLFKA